jgi:hypothetical protein
VNHTGRVDIGFSATIVTAIVTVVPAEKETQCLCRFGGECDKSPRQGYGQCSARKHVNQIGFHIASRPDSECLSVLLSADWGIFWPNIRYFHHAETILEQSMLRRVVYPKDTQQLGGSNGYHRKSSKRAGEIG